VDSSFALKFHLVGRCRPVNFRRLAGSEPAAEILSEAKDLFATAWDFVACNFLNSFCCSQFRAARSRIAIQFRF
jgi:hypothetical protein